MEVCRPNEISSVGRRIGNRYVDSILGIFFRDIALNFILAARK